jgi:hypothetical protein
MVISVISLYRSITISVHSVRSVIREVLVLYQKCFTIQHTLPAPLKVLSGQRRRSDDITGSNITDMPAPIVQVVSHKGTQHRTGTSRSEHQLIKALYCDMYTQCWVMIMKQGSIRPTDAVLGNRCINCASRNGWEEKRRFLSVCA